VAQSPVSIIITPGASGTQQNSDERTPEAVAVVITKTEGGSCNSDPSTVSPGTTDNSLFLNPGQTSSESYLDYIANVVQSNGIASKCPGWVTVGQCTNGHQFVKEIYCGREWCPVCGADESPAHLRRFSRWVPKAQQLVTMGYLVFTIPEGERYKYRNKASLNYLVKRVTGGDKSQRIEGLLKSMGFSRGMVRIHFFGDTPGKYHPHINVIIEAGYLSPVQLEMIRLSWAGILGVDTAVVNYSYTAEIPKMVHILKYVTRATFRDYTWDGYMAGELYNFRNMRTWGKWDGAPVWTLDKGAGAIEAVAKLEAGLCPICGAAVAWGKARDVGWLEMWAHRGTAHQIGAGYWSLDSS
jgi:hypothetical protein